MKFGFSLLEILLAMAILVVLGMIATSSFVGYRNTVEAEEEINKIRSLLRSAQGKAIALEENSQWGVRFSNPASGPAISELFVGAAYPGAIKETTYLSSRFMFVNPASDATQDIIFQKRSGKTTNPGDITITIKPKSGATPIKSVTITTEGKIE